MLMRYMIVLEDRIQIILERKINFQSETNFLTASLESETMKSKKSEPGKGCENFRSHCKKSIF